MLIAKNYLSLEDYRKYKAQGVKIFLFNEIDFIPPEHEAGDDVFYNCTRNRVASTWYTWNENNKLILSLGKKFPGLFMHQGYNITLAIQKAMFWSNFKTGFLWYTVQEFFPSEKIFYIEPLQQAGKSGVIYRYLRNLLNARRRKSKSFADETKPYKYAVHIKNNFQINLYRDILGKVIDDKEFAVIADPDVDVSYMSRLGFSNIQIPEIDKSCSPLKWVNFLRINKKEWYVLSTILLHWKEICYHMQAALNIKHKGLKAVLVNEAENGIYGAIMSEVMHSNGTVVYNTMNGIKSGEAQDAFINFDKWFVWDEQMKEMLHSLNGIEMDKLLVSGHLMEDLIMNYTYSHSLDLDPELLKDKKVISLFSVKGRRYVKLEAIRCLFKLLENDDSYYLLIRPHPSEKPEDYILPEQPLKNLAYIKYNSRNLYETLHDQLLLSDVSIVFGSTVALDSKWMDVPCITFERREQSLIYCVDGEKIIHVKTLEDLQHELGKIKQKKHHTNLADKASVSDFILKEIKRN